MSYDETVQVVQPPDGERDDPEAEADLERAKQAVKEAAAWGWVDGDGQPLSFRIVAYPKPSIEEEPLPMIVGAEADALSGPRLG